MPLELLTFCDSVSYFVAMLLWCSRDALVLHFTLMYCFFYLKVLSSEKRGNLKVVAFDRSPFKLFTLRFSNKSVQTPSCERPRTAQRTLFLSFESNNCFPITVQCRRLMKKSGKLPCHVVNSNIAIGSLPTLQLSVWCENRVAARHYADIGKQLLLANSRNRVRGAVLGLSQDGACTNLC